MKLHEIKLFEATATEAGVEAIEQFLEDLLHEHGYSSELLEWVEGGAIVMSHSSPDVHFTITTHDTHYILGITIVGTDLDEFEPGDVVMGIKINGDEPIDITVNVVVPASFAVEIAVSQAEDAPKLFEHLQAISTIGTTTVHETFKETKYWDRNGFADAAYDDEEGDDDEDR
jgi:hypothetical protein